MITLWARGHSKRLCISAINCFVLYITVCVRYCVCKGGGVLVDVGNVGWQFNLTLQQGAHVMWDWRKTCRPLLTESGTPFMCVCSSKCLTNPINQWSSLPGICVVCDYDHFCMIKYLAFIGKVFFSQMYMQVSRNWSLITPLAHRSITLVFSDYGLGVLYN